MSAEKCLSKEARKCEAKNKMCINTGSELQSATHEGKKDRSLLLLEGYILSECLCHARSEAKGGSLDCREGDHAGLTTSRKAVAYIDGVSTQMLALRFPLERARLTLCYDLHVILLLQTESWSLSTRR